MQHLECKMLRAIPTFDSAYPREFSQWIAQMDQLFMGSGYDMLHIHYILGIKLLGSACTNVLHHINNAQSWPEICATLVRKLSNILDVIDLITAFRQLRQNSGPIQDYNPSFMSISIIPNRSQILMIFTCFNDTAMAWTASTKTSTQNRSPRCEIIQCNFQS